jgi:hypothetical protein
MNRELYIAYQSCNLSQALLRNINDNFISVSFSVLMTGEILVKIVLEQQSEKELEYIDDLMAEFSSIQTLNCVLPVNVHIGLDILPSEHLVYTRKKPTTGSY